MPTLDQQQDPIITLKDEILLYLLTGWEGLLNAEIAGKMAEDLARIAAHWENSK